MSFNRYNYSLAIKYDLEARRNSSQITNSGIQDSEKVYLSSISSETSTGTSDDESVRCPFLNKDHIPNLTAIREELREYFRHRNRIEQLRKRPWIFLIQLSKIILITVMLTSLSTNNYEIRRAISDIKSTLSNILIKDYDKNDPNRILYSFDDLEDTAVNAAKQYLDLSGSVVSLLGYPKTKSLTPENAPSIGVELKHYACVNISANWDVHINDTVLTEKRELRCSRSNMSCVDDNRELLSVNERMKMRLLRFTMRFELEALLIGYLSKPHCILLWYELFFENPHRANGLQTDANLSYVFQDCNSTEDNVTVNSDYIYFSSISVDLGVLVTTLVSLVTVSLKFRYSCSLYKRTRRFIEKSYNRKINRQERHLFLNYWHMSIFVSDIMLSIASTLKLLIDIGIQYNFDTCTLLLGIGVWLSYLGLLRYLLFDRHYSMLLNTINVALPHLGRFIICVTIIFTAFLFSGWLVLSPYCSKFEDVWVTMETLFSLLNGDDMFATFSLVHTSNPFIKIYSRIYLYAFVSFFIYLVLSLCISIIEDAYTVVSNYRSDSCPWIQNSTVFPEFVTSWEKNFKRNKVPKTRPLSRHAQYLSE